MRFAGGVKRSVSFRTLGLGSVLGLDSKTLRFRGLLGGSWDLVSKVISTLRGVISVVTLITTLVTKSHDPLRFNTEAFWV